MHSWFDTKLGKFLLKRERERCRTLLPSGFYPNGLQVGMPNVNFLTDLMCDNHFFIGEQPPCANKQFAGVYCSTAAAEAMPFAHKTHDLIILPHTLDYCKDPHAVLREANQILNSLGYILIIGFNAFSTWSLVAPPSTHNRGRYRPRRVQDWLSLLGFELVAGAMLLYQPPLQNEKWRAKFEAFDKIGERWLPTLGGVYIIVARKHELTATARNSTAASWQKWVSKIPQVARQNTARN